MTHKKPLNNRVGRANSLIGRSEDIQKIRRLLMKYPVVNITQPLAGYGKTQVLKYMKKLFQKSSTFDHIVYLSLPPTSPTVNFQKMVANDLVLLKQLNVNWEVGQSHQVRFEKVIKKLRRLKGTKLMLIDNALPEVDLLVARLPHQWRFLITSDELLSDTYTHYSLLPLEPSGAQNLFAHYCSRTSVHRPTLYYLLKYINYQPLGIRLLATTLEHQPYLTLEQFLGKVQGYTLDQQLLQHTLGTSQIPDDLSSIFTCLITLFEVSNLSWLAEELLQILALLPSDPIPRKLFIVLAQTLANQDQLLASIDELKKKGWITFASASDTLLLHPWLQSAILYACPPTYEKHQKLITLIKDQLNLNPQTYDPKEAIYWLPIVQRLLMFFLEENAVIARLWTRAGVVCEDWGDPQQALNHHFTAWKIAQKLDQKGLMATILSNVVLVYIGQNEYQKAKNKLKQVLELDIQTYGELHPMVIRTTTDLISLHHHLEESEEAQRLSGMLVERELRHFWDNHTNITAVTLSLNQKDITLKRHPVKNKP